MTLNEYYLKHGTDGLNGLVERCKVPTKLSYIQQLIYSPKKRPSTQMAAALIEASNNELTLTGLANPVKVLQRDLKAAQ